MGNTALIEEKNEGDGKLLSLFFSAIVIIIIIENIVYTCPELILLTVLKE